MDFGDGGFCWFFVGVGVGIGVVGVLWGDGCGECEVCVVVVCVDVVGLVEGFYVCVVGWGCCGFGFECV